MGVAEVVATLTLSSLLAVLVTVLFPLTGDPVGSATSTGLSVGSTIGPPSVGPSAGSSAGSSSEPPAGSPGPGVAADVELDPLPDVVPRLRPVPLTGTVQGLSPGTRLVVQYATGLGSWTSFPLRPAIGDDGAFRTYVELGTAGTHRLRVVGPGGLAASAVLVVQVR